MLGVTCEHLDARLPSEYAGFGEKFLRARQAHTNGFMSFEWQEYCLTQPRANNQTSARHDRRTGLSF